MEGDQSRGYCNTGNHFYTTIGMADTEKYGESKRCLGMSNKFQVSLLHPVYKTDIGQLAFLLATTLEIYLKWHNTFLSKIVKMIGIRPNNYRY